MDDRHGNAKRTSIYIHISIFSLGTRDSRILGELLLGTTVRVSFCILHLGVGQPVQAMIYDVCMRVGNNSFCCLQKKMKKRKKNEQ